jgi:hypothetical protein
MSDYTPGPWAWQLFGKEYCLTGQHGMRPIVLATRKNGATSLVNGLLVPLDPNHPDAKLIAAAPKMFALLTSATDERVQREGVPECGWDNWNEDAIALIKEIKGQ